MASTIRTSNKTDTIRRVQSKTRGCGGIEEREGGIPPILAYGYRCGARRSIMAAEAGNGAKKQGAFVAKRTVLAEKLDQVRTRIVAACAKAKRDPKEVTLVAVTKSAAPEQGREILQLGVGDLGENRVQALTQRAMQITEFHQRRVAACAKAKRDPKEVTLVAVTKSAAPEQ